MQSLKQQSRMCARKSTNAYLFLFLVHSVKSEVRNDFGIFVTTSRLLIANLNVQETGFYSCSMGTFGKATVFVSVVNGKLRY